MLNTGIDLMADGIRVRVARLGTALDEPIVLLHGYPDNVQVWSQLAPILAMDRTVIAFDWPGMGASDAWKGGTTPWHQSDRLIALFDHWGIGRAIVVAMDMGGQPALVFAARHPQRIHRLIVMNSLVMWDERTSWEIALLRRFGWNRWLLRHCPGLIFRRALRTVLPVGQHVSAAVRNDMWECFRRDEVRAFIARLCAGYQGTLAQLPEVYAQVSCPTLILWGEDDAHFPVAHAQRLHALIPHAKIQVIHGGAHWMVWHQADACAAYILRFVANAPR
jgi:pimeloyl-ACP methyl ester carboxylesterase